jgi:hypothetical protein
MSTTTTSSNGIGFFGLLTILFVGLKLTGYINWSWFWVLSPLIFSCLIGLLFLLLVLMIFIIAIIKNKI